MDIFFCYLSKTNEYFIKHNGALHPDFDQGLAEIYPGLGYKTYMALFTILIVLILINGLIID